MAEGYDDFGVQDIVVNKDNDGKYSIGFEYFGEVQDNGEINSMGYLLYQLGENLYSDIISEPICGRK